MMWNSERAGGNRPPASPSRLRTGLLGCMAALLVASAAPAEAKREPRSPAYQVSAEIRSLAGKDLKAFYKDRGYRPLWIQGTTLGPEADRLLNLISTAELDGLSPSDFELEDLGRTIKRARFEGEPEDLARAELRLSRTFAAYVRAVRRPPAAKITYLDKELEPEPLTTAGVLRAAALAPSLAQYLNNEGWVSPFYAQLRDGLVEHRMRWGQLPYYEVPTGPLLKAGSKGDRVRALRLRLGLGDGTDFDETLANQVRDFQSAHGLHVDGLVGGGTIAALNRGPSYYDWLIRLNMDRTRALPPAGRGRHIVVDAGSARLWTFEDGVLRDTMKVIVGKPTEQTPMLAGMMRYAVVNPYWNLPPDLVVRRIVPKVVDEGATLRKLGYEALSDWTTQARILDQDEIDWAAVADGRQELRVRQLPGKTNAMGRMKFMFPNDLGVYLHDTPDKELFDDAERRFSSGCVRLEDAPRLAEWLFGHPLEAPSDEPEQQVFLDSPVPVYITYLTASPTDDGIAFREDAYGRDEGGFGSSPDIAMARQAQ